MYNCSTAFHTAVGNSSPQKALLIFSDCVFTNDDINVDNGIEFRDNFNLEEDICIGQTPSNEINFSLFNDDRLLNSYGFGEFEATLGVRTSLTSYSAGDENATVTTGNGIYTAHPSVPYLRKNGLGVATQPSAEIFALLAWNGKLYCFGDNYAIVYNESGMSTASVTVNAFMKAKAKRNWQGKGMWLRQKSGYDSKQLDEWQNGMHGVFEFVPLGIFDAERPKVPNVIEIDFTCYDRMMKFDRDMPTAEEMGLTYPTTIGELYSALCTYAGVPKRSQTFINQDADIEKEPEAFRNATMRTVLGWIAEAAGSNARIDRDGYVKLDWLRSTGQSYSETKYMEFLPYWYTTEKVGKLYNRSTKTGDDTIITSASGTGAYLIQDNPLLADVAEAGEPEGETGGE